jgi:uncharacterized protein YegP (UPF0339 family)
MAKKKIATQPTPQPTPKSKRPLTIDYWEAVRWYFRVKSSNGRVIAQSDGFPSESSCLKAIAALQEGAATAKVKLI